MSCQLSWSRSVQPRNDALCSEFCSVLFTLLALKSNASLGFLARLLRWHSFFGPELTITGWSSWTVKVWIQRQSRNLVHSCESCSVARKAKKAQLPEYALWGPNSAHNRLPSIEPANFQFSAWQNWMGMNWINCTAVLDLMLLNRMA